VLLLELLLDVDLDEVCAMTRCEGNMSRYVTFSMNDESNMISGNKVANLQRLARLSQKWFPPLLLSNDKFLNIIHVNIISH
jgi:hypothetical protein